MDAVRWQKIQTLFDRLANKTPSHRCDYLNMVCEDDKDLRVEVEQLLRAHDQVSADNPPKPIGMPEHIGHYQVLEKLGQGGMGAVYRVKDSHQNEFALKIFPRFITENSHAKRRFEQEATALEQLSHPFVCQLYDTFIFQQQACIVMELCFGEPLSQQIDHVGCSFKQCLQIIQGLTQALVAVHRLKIYHRDIKPSNIMVDDQHNIKLIDFGIAKFADVKLTATGIIVGSPSYMSPEQWQGKLVDHHCDLWALGVLFYEWLTGNLPFGGHSRQEKMLATLHQEPAKLPERIEDKNTENLQLLLDKLLSKNIHQRYGDIREFQLDFSELT